MLYKFLIENREKILAAARKKSLVVSGEKPTTAISDRGLPNLLDRITGALEREVKGRSAHAPRKHGRSTASHGRELSRLGYTVSQVVHGYGCLCQSITELATKTNAPISAGEYRTLNLKLDEAIADAVTGFTENASASSGAASAQVGVLVHELRNVLSAAMVAHSMVKKGIVDPGGKTNALLERNLHRMRDILDSSFSEERLRRNKPADLRPLRLLEISEEVEAAASEEARSRGLGLVVRVDPRLEVDGDRLYLISALSNLVQNAIKASTHGGTIWLRSRETGREAVLEVEDRCGGLPGGKTRELFKPFVQKGSDRSGLGLGLAISRQAVALNGGTLAARDLPGKGCVFTIALPKRKAAESRGSSQGLDQNKSSRPAVDFSRPET